VLWNAGKRRYITDTTTLEYMWIILLIVVEKIEVKVLLFHVATKD